MKNDNQGWLYFSLIVEIGLNMILAILIFFFLGLYCDNKFNLRGVGIISGIIIGVLGGVYNSYKAIINLDKKLK
jgi:F0F1-type ATP synthase assembly protein I